MEQLAGHVGWLNALWIKVAVAFLGHPVLQCAVVMLVVWGALSACWLVVNRLVQPAKVKEVKVGDTILFDHVFTATGTINVAGIHVCNNDDDVAFIECCFNAVLAMENADTLTIDGQSTIDQA